MADDRRVILVADDDPGLRFLLRTTLEGDGLAVHEAEDGIGALEAALRCAPDLILLDWAMPGRSGVEVCQVLRSQPETAATKIVMLTARSQPADREAALAAGADGYLTKPFSPLALLDTVTAMLGHASFLQSR